MKTKFFFSVAILSAMLLAGLASCDKDDDSVPEKGKEKDPRGCIEAVVQSIDVPEGIQAGVPATFGLEYVKPNPCYSLAGIFTDMDGFELDLKVCLDLHEDLYCIQIIVVEEGDFTVTFPQSGLYILEFKGPSGPESLTVEVN